MNNLTGSLKPIGLAADHAGFDLKEYIKAKLLDAGYQIIDYGNSLLIPDDDYPDYVIPLAQAVASGEVDRGIAICGSGVGACIAANKVKGTRACMIHETFSAHQGVEDDDMNMICLGGRVIGQALAWEVIITFLAATFKEKERYIRRLNKILKLEAPQPPKGGDGD